MERSYRSLTLILLAMVAMAAVGVPAWGQKAKPKAKAAADAGFGEDADAAKPKAKSRQPAADSKAPAKPTAIPQPAEPEDPSVQAVLDSKPSTPAEWVDVAKSLARLGKPKLAKPFLQKVLAAKLTPKQLADLGERLGPAALLDIGGRPELAPEGRQVADAVLAAMDDQSRDPQRLADLIKQLQSPSAETRYGALLGLRQGREAAVGALAAVLADSSRAAEHPMVRAALARFGADAIEPLIAILDSAEAKLRGEAIQALAAMEAGEATVFLLAPCVSPQSTAEVRAAAESAFKKLAGRIPSKSEAANTLVSQARLCFAGRLPIREEQPGQARMWFWDNAKKQLVVRTTATAHATRALAARLARDAYTVAPEDPSIRTLHLATTLELAAHENGLDKPLKADPGTVAASAAAFGAPSLEAVLELAMTSQHAPAATAAARILGQIGKAEDQLYRSGQAAPLVRAVRHPDARLRFAAVEAILALRPTRPFPGSSFVTEALEFFVSSKGARRILVADASVAEARRLTGYLAALGYQLDTATTGREALLVAMESPDYELVLVDTGLDQPTVGFVIQQLRHDFRTGSLPVGIMARAGHLERARHLAEQDELSDAFPRIHAEESMRAEVQRLLALSGQTMVSLAERQQQALRAAQWLVELSKADRKLFDLGRLGKALVQALEVPSLSPHAAAVLATMGTAESQKALVELASRPAVALPIRKAALAAFQENTRKYGILLTIPEVYAQYDRYNQSRDLDRPTQEVLGLILDAIEAPSQAVKSARQPDDLPGKGGQEAKKG